MKNQTGAFFDEAAVNAFLDNAPEMVEWFERETEVKFVPTMYPDYHPDAPGGVDIGRSILAAPYNARNLGAEIGRLRPPLDDHHLRRHDVQLVECRPEALLQRDQVAGFGGLRRQAAGQPLQGPGAVSPRRAGHERQRPGGAARQELLRPRHPDPHQRRSARAAAVADGRVTGALVRGKHDDLRITARRGVVLACGGYPHDVERITKTYPHLQRGGEHLSPVPDGQHRRRPEAGRKCRRQGGHPVRRATARRPGCRCRACRCRAASSASSRTCSTATSPASSACCATAGASPTSRTRTTTSAPR